MKPNLNKEIELLNLTSRKFWPHGEWDNEPDFKEFTYKGYYCYIKRNRKGSLCGYTFIPLDHPILKNLKSEETSDYENIPIDVHGGITFGKYATMKDNNERGYVVGFDCNHAGDYSPSSECFLHPENHERKNNMKGFLGSVFNKYETYKNMEFVTKEIESMVDQIIAYGENNETKSE